MKRSSSLRVYFAIECVVWLTWLVFDLATARAQFEIARSIPIHGMTWWFAASVIVNVAMVVSSALGTYLGAGVFSHRLSGSARGLLLVLGVTFRVLLGIVMLIWISTMSGAQSV